MLDLKFVRSNPELVRDSLRKRGERALKYSILSWLAMSGVGLYWLKLRN